MGESHRFLCVSGVLRDRLVAAFPHHSERIEVLPNAVAIERMPLRESPVIALHRWLYVGRLLPHKGVRRLLAAFARCAADDEQLKLTLLGDGRLAPELAARAATSGSPTACTCRVPCPTSRWSSRCTPTTCWSTSVSTRRSA